MIAALLGIAANQQQSPSVPALSNGDENELRKAQGGQIAPLPTTRTRWYMADLEEAEHAADRGQLSSAAQLMRAAMRDGVLSGVMSTRTGGLVRLPKRFRGRADIVTALESGVDEARSVFDEMLPGTELEKLAADGVLLGVGVGEFVDVVGRDYPVFVRLNPEFLLYIWSENRWYYRSIIGLLPITPGDGRWVLHTPGGRNAPWQWGLWRAVGRAFIRKEHALLHLDNWTAKLANPARAAIAPAGSTVDDRTSFVERLVKWGINTVFALPVGWDVKLIESNGRGYESFRQTVDDQNNEFVIAVCGQTVTTDGGTGFSNASVHKSIRADLIKATADALAHTVNTQCLPQYVISHFGEDALYESVCVEWDVTPPQDKTAEATAAVQLGLAIKALDEVLASRSMRVDVRALAARFGVPVEDAPAQAPSLSLTAANEPAQAPAQEAA